MSRSTGITLAKNKSEPLYKQLFDQIVERVMGGAFPAGFRLPPTRVLAAELRTNRNTIVRAYADLEAAGFVTSTVGRGTFVAVAAKANAKPSDPQPGGLPWASIVSSYARHESLRRAGRFTRSGGARDAINLTRMQPSADLLPDRLIRRCFDHVFRTLGAKVLGYGPVEGLASLRELIVHDLARQGVPAHADEMIITTGSQGGS